MSTLCFAVSVVWTSDNGMFHRAHFLTGESENAIRRLIRGRVRLGDPTARNFSFDFVQIDPATLSAVQRLISPEAAR